MKIPHPARPGQAEQPRWSRDKMDHRPAPTCQVGSLSLHRAAVAVDAVAIESLRAGSAAPGMGKAHTLHYLLFR
jgi:hypothetical protein